MQTFQIGKSPNAAAGVLLTAVIFFVKIDTFLCLMETTRLASLMCTGYGDADALRSPRKTVDVAGCSPRPRSVWHKPFDDTVFGGREA